MIYKHISHIVFLLLLACIASSLNAQQTRFRVTHYDEISGLQTSIINALMQDSKGYMWFGTADGLYRYDGYTFKAFRNEKKSIACLTITY